MALGHCKAFSESKTTDIKSPTPREINFIAVTQGGKPSAIVGRVFFVLPEMIPMGWDFHVRIGLPGRSLVLSPHLTSVTIGASPLHPGSG